MHWIWRAVICVTVGMAAGRASVLAFEGLANRLLAVGGRNTSFALVVFAFLSSHAVTVLVYGLLTRRYYRAMGQDDETRCRKCTYILRGLTEPRCPECGEAI